MPLALLHKLCALLGTVLMKNKSMALIQPSTYAQVFAVKAPLSTSSGLFVCLPLAFTYSVEPEPVALSNENN